MDDCKITAGPDNNSVILLHKINDVLQAIELIFDLNVNYMTAYKNY